MLKQSLSKKLLLSRFSSASLKIISDCGRMVCLSTMLSFLLWFYPNLMESILTVKRRRCGSPLCRQELARHNGSVAGWRPEVERVPEGWGPVLPPNESGCPLPPSTAPHCRCSHTVICTCAGECCSERSSLPQHLHPSPLPSSMPLNSPFGVHGRLATPPPLHNHPTNDPNPSQAVCATTSGVDTRLPGCQA